MPDPLPCVQSGQPLLSTRSVQIAASSERAKRYVEEYDAVVSRKSKVKNGHLPKVCVTCGRPFEWRRKWARDWENVKYCSDRCRAQSAQS